MFQKLHLKIFELVFTKKNEEEHEDYMINEALLVEFYQKYLYVLSHRNGDCVYSLSSFFPVISLVKRYILCKYAIDFPETRQLNRILKGETAGYQPNKKNVFTLEEMKQYLSRGIMNGEDLQDSLLALFAFFGLARSVEVINISREELKFKKKTGVYASPWSGARNRKF